MGLGAELNTLYRWSKGSLNANIGRLSMMAPGLAVTVFALNKFVPMTDSEFRTALGFGGALLLGGYLAPLVKRLTWGKGSLELHDRTALEDSREAATEISTEVQGSGATVEPDEAIDAARFFAANLAMVSILNREVFSGAELHVYLFDVDADGLLPAFGVDERVSAQPPWQEGVGAVGKAWETERFVVAVGDEAKDSTHGLDDAQQLQHSDTTAVAAIPIFNANGTVIGVVSASEHDKPVDECFLATADARGKMEAAADACARVLIDLLGWFADDV